MAAVPNPVFKFSREMHTVQVENIAESASVQDIVDLFTTLIGEVRKCEEYLDGSRRVLGLTFMTHDATKKALCMSGYTVSGVPLTVTAVSPSEVKHNGRQGKQPDARRNLYVLGLPFELTKPEFVEIFSRFGSVAHAVILATVDNASRRRGFIVMNSHNEARAAMDGLSRKEIKGHTIDVSWAVVQRSQGFLDGGDRTTVLNQSPPSTPSPYDFHTSRSSPSSAQCSLRSTPVPEQQGPINVLSVQPASLLVANLPAVLFSQLTDLYPLFCPFGEIKNMQILDSSVAALDRGDISVQVEYANFAQAHDAYAALQGQMYSTKPVEVEFLRKPDGDVPSHAGNDLKTGLNPHAAPFVAPTGSAAGTLFAPTASLYTKSDRNRIAAAHANGILAANPYALSQLAVPSLYNHLCLSAAGTVRPSSAPSWSEPTPDRRPGHWAFSQLDRLSNMSTPSLGHTFTA